MQNIFYYSLKYYFQLICLITVLFYVGKVILHFINFKTAEKQSIFSTFFSPIIMGSLAIIILQSFIVTNFITLNFCLLILFVLFWILYLRNTPPINTSPIFTLKDIRSLPLIYGVVLLFFVLQFFSVYSLDGENFASLSSDSIFYARRIGFFYKTNVESITPYFLDLKNIGPTKYHFGDLWFASVFKGAFGWQLIDCYLIGYPVIFYTILFLGVNQLINSFVKISFAQGFLVILFFGTGSMSYLVDYLFELINRDSIAWAIFQAPKIAIIFAWLIFAIIQAKQKNDSFFIFSLIIISYLYTPMILVCYLAIAMFLAYKFLWLKKGIIKDLLFVFLSGVFIILFYKFFQISDDLALTSIDFKCYYTEKKGILAIVKSLVSVSLTTVLEYLIKILFSFFLYKTILNFIKVNKTELVHLIILLISSIVTFSFTYFIFDSIQFWIIIMSFIGFLFAVGLGFYFLTKKRYTLLFTYLFIVLFHQIHNNEYPLRSWLSKENNFSDYIALKNIDFTDNTIYLQDKSIYNNLHSKKVEINKPLKELFMLNNTYSPICITTSEIPLSQNGDVKLIEFEKNIINNTTFELFLKKHGVSKSQDAYWKNKFILDYKIQYMVVSKNYKLSDILIKSIEKEIINLNGWRFYKLNNEI